MRIKYQKQASRAVLLVTYMSLACKFLIPVGYMPAAVSDGWPVRMCHSGLPEGLFSHDGAHHEHSKKDDLRWENCSLGALVSAAAVTSEHALQVPYLGEAPTPSAHVRKSIDSTVFVFHSRAPPTSTI
jgi:hypothetical protein